MKKILLNIRQIEKVVLNVEVDKARLMVINESHEKVYEHVHDFSSVNRVYEAIANALMNGKQYVEFEL